MAKKKFAWAFAGLIVFGVLVYLSPENSHSYSYLLKEDILSFLWIKIFPPMAFFGYLISLFASAIYGLLLLFLTDIEFSQEEVAKFKKNK